MKCINEAVWITSDSSVFVRYNKARYHEIVLKLRKFIKQQVIIINRSK
jgi:hypothetical protein